jgi:hypothetical protein
MADQIADKNLARIRRRAKDAMTAARGNPKIGPGRVQEVVREALGLGDGPTALSIDDLTAEQCETVIVTAQGLVGGLKEYPESDTLRITKHERSIVVRFLAWLSENNMEVCTRTDEHNGVRRRPLDTSAEHLAQKFVGVDPAKLELERQAMIDDLSGT